MSDAEPDSCTSGNTSRARKNGCGRTWRGDLGAHIVIDGFKIELTADELVRHLEKQIQEHHDRAAECDTKRIRFEAGAQICEDENEVQLARCWIGYGDDLERRAARHKRHEAALTFVRDRILLHEIYRLGIADLRELGLWITSRKPVAAD
jgi:hypothetical protein